MALFVVSTPIGNLEDITLRAVNVLKEADLIACEDTRQTNKLLHKYDIHKKLLSYHSYSSFKRTREIIDLLKNEKNVALVSDSGTPGISDPGYMLIAEALQHGIKVQSIPGPSAVTSACACSGLPCDRFVFLGFLPRRKIRAERLLTNALALNHTVVLYESPHRIKETLAHIQRLFGGSPHLVIAREMTKIFEEIIRGTVQEVCETIANREIKGEIVVLINNTIDKKSSVEA
ncbi:MAG: 16S rRNA (cytidine(1402)-2'-O)-methyltransferase [bacterium]